MQSKIRKIDHFQSKSRKNDESQSKSRKSIVFQSKRSVLKYLIAFAKKEMIHGMSQEDIKKGTTLAS